MGIITSLKTTALLATLTALLVLAGQWLGGTEGLLLALLLALLMNGGAYWWSDRLVLAMAGARELRYAEASGLHQLVAVLAREAGLPMPRVYLIDTPAPNAFATGRSPQHGAVAVTSGLLQLLTHDELAGVIAHELAHIKHRDTLISAIAALLAGAITMLAEMAQWALLVGGLIPGDNDEEEAGLAGMLVGLLWLLLAPLAATLIQLAISRTREFAADTAGAQITGQPLALAAALRKLERWKAQLPLPTSPALAHLYITHPFAVDSVGALFNTHPPTAQRIARLEQLAFGRGVLAGQV